MTPRLTDDAKRLIGEQRGLIADWQAEDVGLNRRRLNRACRSGWRQVTPHVFARDTSEPTASQLRLAGLLEAGPGAALAGRSALLEAGWKGADEGYVDVVLERGGRWRSRSPVPWLRLHFPMTPPRGIGSPCRTTPPRSTIDAAAWSSTARESLVILVSSAQQRLVTPGQLRRELEMHGRIPNRRRIADALAELDLGATSSNEAAFLRECRRRGLPTPRMQTRRRARGRNRITDAEFVLPDGRLLIVEIDGIGHLEVSSWHADISRHNELALSTGALILRVTGWEVHHDPDPFFDMLVDLMHPFR
jgi:very-short-patch-repair endonuclease